MRIVFLTINDPIYLPVFFKKVFRVFGNQTSSVYIVPPLYKNQTNLQAALRYYKTFGLNGFSGLFLRIIRAKLKLQSIRNTCKNYGVKYASLEDVNSSEFLKTLKEFNVEIIVSVSCPQIFKKPLIDLPQLGCLNIHGAILPNYRGIMPSFWMLANDEKQAGVSIYYVNEKIDAGDLCGQRIFDIKPDESLDQFIKRSKNIAADLLIEVLNKIEKNEIGREKIDLNKGSYYSWPEKSTVARFFMNGRKLW